MNIIELQPFKKEFSLSFGKLEKPKKVFDSMEIYSALLNDARNMPNGFQSDHCLTEIFNDCEVSKLCAKIEDINEASFGYSQTHKYRKVCF